MSATINDWFGWSDENAFAGGVSGAAYAENVILQADIKSLPFAYGGQKMPFVDFVWESVKTFGDGAETTRNFLKDMNYKDSELNFLTHATTTGFYTRAVSGVAGLEPWPSFCMVFKKDNLQWAVFGANVEEWTWEGKAGEFNTEKIKPRFYDVQRPTAPTYTRVAFIETDPYVFKDCSFSISGVIDGSITPDATEASITITNKFDDGKVAGLLGHKFSKITNREYEGSLTFYTNITGLQLAYVNSNTAPLANLTYNLGYMTLGITGAKITMNCEEYPDSKEQVMIYQYKVDWDMGSGFVCNKL